MTDSRKIKLDQSWLDQIGEEFDKPYMVSLRKFLADEKQAGQVVYPPGSLMFNALNNTPFDQVKAVILGQDPYHGPNQAHGLCFSVQTGIPVPPSLVNIYKELGDSYQKSPPKSGDLTDWAKQGVLLLNATLSVRRGEAGSHQNRGWETFTDAIIHALNQSHKNIVFLLWGSYAQRKGAFIDQHRHLVLKAPHPSPLSAHRGFFGCGHFQKANDYLAANNITEIDWTRGWKPEQDL